MRKLASLLYAFLFVFVVTSCGDDDDAPADTTRPTIADVAGEPTDVGTTFTLTGTLTDDTGLASVSITYDVWGVNISETISGTSHSLSADIAVPEDADKTAENVLTITVTDAAGNTQSFAYTVTFPAPVYGTVGIIGSATPNSWDASTPMTQDASDPNVWTISIDLTDGEAKFRADDDWAVNWGSTEFPAGTGTQDGDNIPIAAGTYNVTFNSATGAYDFAVQ